MASLSMGLNIAVSALLAQQDSMNVTSNNIANASTSGYSVETADLVTNPPLPTPSLSPSTPGQFGTGVDVQTINRASDQFLDTQYRQQNVLLGQAQQQSTALTQVETIFGDLSSTTGLNTDLDNFWQAWNSLSQDPQQLPSRISLTDTATTLTEDIQDTYNQLGSLMSSLTGDIGGDVTQVNNDLSGIATLNGQIQTATNAGLAPNTLLDKRDSLLDNLSTYVNVKTQINSDNSVTLSVGGATVVQGTSLIKLSVLTGSQVGIKLGNSGKIAIQNSELGGAIYGLQLACSGVNGYMGSLNNLTVAVASGVNGLHKKGYGLSGTTNLPFFVSNSGTTTHINASNIEVNPTLASDPQKIAAASDGVIKADTTNVGTSTTPQVETLVIASGAIVSGALHFIVTASGMAGSPVSGTVNTSGLTTADALASGIASALNAKVGGFFTVTTSGPDVVLTSNIDGADSTMNVTVSGLTGPGDGSNALSIFDLSYAKLGTINDTAGDYYDSMISSLGSQVSQANNTVTNQTALTTQLNNSRQSVSGVNLDEETTNMVEEQNAYEAAAKLVSTIADMMQTVINMVPTD